MEQIGTPNIFNTSAVFDANSKNGPKKYSNEY